VEFEPEIPPHRTLSPISQALEDFVRVLSLGMADLQSSGIDKADARYFSKATVFQKQQQPHRYRCASPS
jgi:hypothetical protein